MFCLTILASLCVATIPIGEVPPVRKAFDLRSLPGSYESAKLLPRSEENVSPKEATSPWSHESTRSHDQLTFEPTGPRFVPGIKVVLAQVTFRYSFDRGRLYGN
jgi:hypothetical protein